MNRYQAMSTKFRLAAGIGAALLTAATFAISIYAPATLSPLDADMSVVATANASPPPTEVTIVPGSIEVVGYREKTVAAAPAVVVVR
jgi:hypothetical protein